jgi:hypothetical protein
MTRPNFPNSAWTLCLVPVAVLGFAASGCVVERTVTEHGETIYQGPVSRLSDRDLLTGAVENPEKLAEEDE